MDNGEFKYLYRSKDGASLTLTTNFKTTPPQEMIYNYIKFHVVSDSDER